MKTHIISVTWVFRGGTSHTFDDVSPELRDKLDALARDHMQELGIEACGAGSKQVVKHLPSEYLHLLYWCRVLGSYDSYIKNEQRRASLGGASLNAIYYDDREKRWRTADEIEGQIRRDTLEALVQHHKKDPARD